METTNKSSETNMEKPMLIKCQFDGSEYWSDSECPRAASHKRLILRKTPMMGHPAVLIVMLFMVASIAWGQNPKDEASYCAYMEAQAKAQADIYRLPSAVAGITQPPQGTPAQLYSGLSDSYTGWRKASETVDAAKKNCALYKATEEATLRLLYAIPSLEKQALQNRLSLISSADAALATLIKDNEQKVEARDMTVPTLYGIQSNQMKLALDRSTTASASAAIFLPALSDTPIRELVQVKQTDELANQKAANKVIGQDDWAMTFEGGVRHQVTTPSPTSGVANTGTGGYATFIFNYNIGHKQINKHLNAAAKSYADWKESQEGDVVQNAEVLRATLSNMTTALEAKQKSLAEQAEGIAKNLASMQGVETSAGVAFVNQLKADELLLRIEIGDTQFRLDNIRKFAQENL